MLITLAGPIGVGKSSMTKLLSELLETKAVYEPVEDNPLLENFYADKKKYGFLFQIDMLSKRFELIQEAMSVKNGILDRSIYEDSIFLKQLYDEGAVGLSKGLKNSKAVVSNAFINYLLSGKDYKEFINECQDLRQFQIITKTGHTFDDTVVIDKDGNESKAQKVNRVFAVKDPEKAVELYKVKNLDNEIKDLTIIE